MPARSVHRVVFLALAFLAVLMSLVGPNVPDFMQIGLLAAGVALLGLPHGALDPLIARVSGVARTPTQLVRFLFAYFVAAALVVGLWWLAPAVSLAGFLLLSAWHFRSDWHAEIPEWQAVSAACTVVCVPAVFHSAAVEEIFVALAFGNSVEPLLLVTHLLGSAALIGLGAAVLRNAIARPLVALELLTLPLLAWALPPLLFFVVYFCGLHSPRHIIDSLQVMQVRWPRVAWVSITVTAVTIAIGVWAYGRFAYAEPTQALLAVVFVGLAALTVPHMLLIERVNLRRSSD